MERSVVVPPTGLRPGVPYSPGIRWGDLVFVSGQTGSHPVTREFADDIETQTRQSLDNVKAVAEAAGATLANALKLTIFMTDMHNEFQRMNAVFREYFPVDPPARSTVGVAHLARPGLKIEIEMIAFVTPTA